ncbi:lipopolysaccharide biosynthesis protein [Chryseobacterium aahli]|uniref:glycosyl transferase family 90 n=1 Tax=Chryseobacterium aahli TaxID=1278643 RepID=UPI001F624A17|nr:glycosyl transferase family 90 [Chryseobacterium aahli]MCI3938159.1 lipopolysaccharide biosynthesis protein [Chryseobacterium aahli]
MTRVTKKNKLSFYIQGFTRGLLPVKSLEKKVSKLYSVLSKEEVNNVERRVDYYNKIHSQTEVAHQGTCIKDLLKPKTPKAYYFDTYEYARYFPENHLIDFAFGDVNTILNLPMITKSRPINGNNENNILLNLDKARHFVSVNDSLNYSQKKDKMIGRAAVFQEHRIKFYENYYNSTLCDLGQVNKNGGNPDWIKPKISIAEHLKNKFILSLEGNDVATNLKWIMSSNSIAVSPPLKMETWYMEGTLKPDEHFIGINEDYKNLEEKLQYYIDHEAEAKDIINNAKEYRAQFNNKNVENLISILVLQKYFNYIR